jgi:PhzF family phenazine biosynthesis protein
MSPRHVPFRQVDVFTAVPYAGNPVAVILDAAGLDTAAMQRIAAWTNLSETTFVTAADVADYHVRIFTPRQELPFAGHPSLGTAHAVIEAGLATPRDGTLTMACGAGVLPLRIDDGGPVRRVAVRAPRARIAEADFTMTVGLAKALGVTVNQEPAPQAVNVGPTWIVVDLEDEAVVRRLAPDLTRVADLTRDYGAVGVAVCGRSGEPGVDLVVRCFVPADGIPEDPVTGSGNAAVAAWLRAVGRLGPGRATYRVSQGREVGRDGYLDMTVEADDAVWVGGAVVTCMAGTVRLD